MESTSSERLVNLKFINAFVSAFRVLETGRDYASGNAFYRIFERYLTKALEEYAETFQDVIPPNIREKWIFMFEQHSAVNEIINENDIKEINRIQPELKKIEDVLRGITQSYDKGGGSGISNVPASPSNNDFQRKSREMRINSARKAQGGFKKNKKPLFEKFETGKLPMLVDNKFDTFNNLNRGNPKNKKSRRNNETESKLDSQVYNPYTIGKRNLDEISLHEEEGNVVLMRNLGNREYAQNQVKSSKAVKTYVKSDSIKSNKYFNTEAGSSNLNRKSLHLKKKIKSENFIGKK